MARLSASLACAIAADGSGGKDARNLTVTNKANDSAPQYSPNGRFLSFVQQRIRGFYGDKGRLMLHDLSEDKARELFRDWDRSAGGLLWAPDSRRL